MSNINPNLATKACFIHQPSQTLLQCLYGAISRINSSFLNFGFFFLSGPLIIWWLPHIFIEQSALEGWGCLYNASCLYFSENALVAYSGWINPGVRSVKTLPASMRFQTYPHQTSMQVTDIWLPSNILHVLMFASAKTAVMCRGSWMVGPNSFILTTAVFQC